MADYSKDFRVSYDEAADSCKIAFRCFDTPNSVNVFGVGDIGDDIVEDALLSVRRLCLKLHRLWSFSYAQSDISRINGTATKIDVDPLTARLLCAMKQYSGFEPAFDFTVGPVSFLWKHASAVPPDAQIREALSHVGADKVHIDNSSVVKDDPLVQVDVGGAAKGFAADLIVQMLAQAGVTCANVDLGGNLFMMGAHPEGRPWRVAVRVPEGMDIPRIVLELNNASVVTSGSYERFVEIDGARYQHIVDAQTGWPSESDIVSATVVSESSFKADVLATTACLVGSEGLSSLAQRHPSCTFVAITADGRILR